MPATRSGAGTAVERKRKRPVLGLLAVERVGDVENVSFDVASVVILERHQAGRGRGMQRLSADMDFVMRHHWRLLRDFLFGLWLSRLGRRIGRWRRRSRLSGLLAVSFLTENQKRTENPSVE